MSRNIYLDFAAATPVDPKVQETVEPFFSDKFYNPSASYLAAKHVRKDLEQARAGVASWFGCRPAEVIFTAGATEANNLAIQGVMNRFHDGEILVSAIEHESVLEPAKLFKHRLIPVKSDGVIDLDQFEKMINHKTVMVSIGLVNNELGTVQPIPEVAKILNKSSILLHTDAAQAPNYYAIQVARLGVDLLSINGGKIYGPKQSGALYIKAGTKLEPLILGGGQELNLRSGTENVAGAVGLATALDLSQNQRKAESERINKLRSLFIEQLKTKLPKSVINGPKKGSAPHILSVTFPDQDNERLMIQLDEAGIVAATGSACAAANVEPSHVLSAIGLSNDQAHSTLRFSLGRQTTADDIHQTVELLSQLIIS
jgi:cysteine desulfurase